MREGRRRPSLPAGGWKESLRLSARNEGGAPAPLVGGGDELVDEGDTPRNEGGAPAPLVGL